MPNTVPGIHGGLDTHANRPAANTVPDGSLYSCSTHALVYKSNYAGNSWATYANLGGGTRAIEFIIDGGGAAITAGVKGDIEVPFACTITGWRVLADQSGSITVGIWKDTYANFPPVVGDLLVSPTLTAAVKAEATGLSHALAAGDILRFNADATPATVQRVTVSLTVVL